MTWRHYDRCEIIAVTDLTALSGKLIAAIQQYPGNNISAQ